MDNNNTQLDITKEAEQQDAIAKKAETQRKLAQQISIALEMKLNFEMYTYRIIPPEEFIERNEELIKAFK